MDKSSSLVKLAQKILEEAEKVEAGGNGEGSADALFEATQELQTSLLTAPKLLEQHQIRCECLGCLKWLTRFEIFKHVPADLSPIAYTDLAAKANVPIRRLQSVVRMVMTDGIFVEPSPMQIAHTQLSASFATDSALLDWAFFIYNYQALAAYHFTEATAKWPNSVAKNETAFNLTLNTDLTFFEHLEAHPDMNKAFSGYMRALQRSGSGSVQHIVDGFDWVSLGEANIVDVGGSTAHASIALASAFPDLHFTIQDLPEVVSEGKAKLPQLTSTSVASRINFSVHNFFTPQPNGLKPDIFFLRRILHNWPDHQAREILNHLAVALRDSGNSLARILVMDSILPLPGTLPRFQDAYLRVRDLTMNQLFNSRERELEEWKGLFASTEPKLELKAWKEPPGSNMAVMEVTLVGRE
ncbi:hypothetical protein COCMIDRAFT_106343 [Bipolaris oryzae ATCC 44560]|uniref:O-methyltransferase C-terminal domain-containing protein n=1 Tax=Bipolaris oryzae ATCC 44560 TaxID=930090 RepID=W6YUZ0_COCMI|nr:uncharacterized protein COCMIDRAFT_106343 [Bipolaris oryzae ATCC 44560]EUC41365.1 hypothetical protein COCMIDRAFT_106343 [Bipolaris oryzae ATCC 44560]